MVSRGGVEEVLMPSYEDSLGGWCLLCKNNKKYALISLLVEHVHRRWVNEFKLFESKSHFIFLSYYRHDILGGSQYLMLDADRLLKGGYINLG